MITFLIIYSVVITLLLFIFMLAMINAFKTRNLRIAGEVKIANINNANVSRQVQITLTDEQERQINLLDHETIIYCEMKYIPKEENKNEQF